ncbi:MAG TPA: TetR/AcrR family transcriptional regulator [Trebonia sp.]|jgi:AcrR family transcriptional regulator
MGRVAGVTAAQTRERLLAAAADAFARNGYDGTRVAEIAKAAKVSNGALYAHFASKAELLAAALREHGPRLLDQTLGSEPGRPVTAMLMRAGRKLRHRRDACGELIVEALAAARRDADLAVLMREYVGERGQLIAERVRQAQDHGEIDPALTPTAVAHFCLLLGLGSALVTPDLHAVGEDEWSALLTTLIRAISSEPSPGRHSFPQDEEQGENA